MGKVLIAEDEPALLESYCEIVTAMGHDCVRAQDGKEALDLARAERPDVVVTDHMMPGVTGLELARALRVDPTLYGVPVIVISAGRPREQERKAAWRFLYKPVGVRRLEQSVSDAMKAAEQVAPRVDSTRPVSQASPISLAREEMLSWVSHEIKTPLSAALTATELARRSVQLGDTSTLDKRLITITHQLVRMNELVNSLLDAAQLQDGKLQLEIERVDIADLTREAIGYWRDLHPDVEFELQDGAQILVEADRMRLRQIIDNLLSNACKYGRPGNHVSIRIASDGDTVSISVSDQGRGIPEDQLRTIFDRFHRVAGSGGRGHGLGLSIASALARLHGGELTARSELERGSTFTLTVPRLAAG